MKFDVRPELKKLDHIDKMNALNLMETKVIVDAWRANIKNLTPNMALAFEQACWLTLRIEWGDDVQIYFDYDKKNVHCKAADREMLI